MYQNASSTRYVCRLACYAEKEVGVGLKAVWYGAEVLGKVVGRGQEQANSEAIQTQQLSREECIAAIKADYETSYFVSGKVGLASYLRSAVVSASPTGHNNCRGMGSATPIGITLHCISLPSSCQSQRECTIAAGGLALPRQQLPIVSMHACMFVCSTRMPQTHAVMDGCIHKQRSFIHSL